jgi:hypothetical protein
LKHIKRKQQKDDGEIGQGTRNKEQGQETRNKEQGTGQETRTRDKEEVEGRREGREGRESR